MTVALGTFWCSIKHIEAPYVFDWVHGIGVHTMQGIRASSPAEGDVSWDFSSCSRNLGIFSSYSRDGHSKIHFVQQSQDCCLLRTDTSGIYNRLGRTIWTLLEVRQKTEVHFLAGTVILGFLSIFKYCQASSPCEALNSVCLSRGLRDVRPPVQMR